MIHLLEAENLQKMIEKNEAIVIDVREQAEYNETHIDGSILIPLGTLTMEKVQKIAKDGKKIVFQCRSGMRSMKACQMLMEDDDELDVYNLEGGIIAWNALKKSSKGGSGIGGCNS